MSRRLLLIWAVSLLWIGCNKSAPPSAAALATNADASAAAPSPEAELSNLLAEMTQALRRYSVEKRQVPASLNDLVAAGYLKTIPQPPRGKSFAIDAKNLQVVVK